MRNGHFPLHNSLHSRAHCDSFYFVGIKGGVISALLSEVSQLQPRRVDWLARLTGSALSDIVRLRPAVSPDRLCSAFLGKPCPVLSVPAGNLDAEFRRDITPSSRCYPTTLNVANTTLTNRKTSSELI